MNTRAYARELFAKHGFYPVEVTQDRSDPKYPPTRLTNNDGNKFNCHALIFDNGLYYIHFHEYANGEVHLRTLEANHGQIEGEVYWVI